MNVNEPKIMTKQNPDKFVLKLVKIHANGMEEEKSNGIMLTENIEIKLKALFDSGYTTAKRWLI